MTTRRLLILLMVTALVLMTIDTRGSGPFGSARSAAFAATAPFRSFVAAVAQPVSATWNGAVHYDDVTEENERLRADVARLEGEVARLPDVEADLAALKEATGLTVDSSVPRLTAKIVSDRDTAVERIIEIDRGSADGVRVGMPVVVGSGLVGQVLDVYGDHRSTLRLVSDPRFDVGVSGVVSGETGVASGDGDDRPLRVEIQAQALSEVSEGERFETNAFSERFPPDIPVGEFHLDNASQVATLEPFVDLETLVFVTVLLTEPLS
jgi:rod shape-determining protein MreC